MVVVLAMTACGTSGATDAGPDALQAIAHRATVTAGGAFEANFIMKGEAKLTCDFVSSGVSLTWDVHTHDGGVQVLDSGVDSAAQIAFVAPREAGYSLLWENLDMINTELDVSCVFEGDVRFHSWYPPG